MRVAPLFYSCFPFRSNFSVFRIPCRRRIHVRKIIIRVRAHATCVLGLAMSQWKVQWEAKKGPGSDSSHSKATETSTGESMSLSSSHSSGGAVASSSFSGAWSHTSHRLGGTIMHLSMYCPRYHPTGKGGGFDLYEINCLSPGANVRIKCPP